MGRVSGATNCRHTRLRKECLLDSSKDSEERLHQLLPVSCRAKRVSGQPHAEEFHPLDDRPLQTLSRSD